MADEEQRSELDAEVAELHKQQVDAQSSATFLGWTQKEKAAFDERLSVSPF